MIVMNPRFEEERTEKTMSTYNPMGISPEALLALVKNNIVPADGMPYDINAENKLAEHYVHITVGNANGTIVDMNVDHSAMTSDIRSVYNLDTEWIIAIQYKGVKKDA